MATSRHTNGFLMICAFFMAGFFFWLPGCSKPKTDVTQNLDNNTMSVEDLRKARREAQFRTRRIIMNNDGNDFVIQSEEDLENPRAFLEKRTAPLLDSQVDSIFYCTGVFNKYSHPMEECELLPDRIIKTDLVEPMKAKDIDSLKIMTEFCHEKGKEIFWSMRMNDIHDSSPNRRDLFAQWKADHPKYLVGAFEDREKMPYGCQYWSAVDYGREEVREKVFRIISEICRRYDVDGIEMDFYRHLILFREQVWEGMVPQKRLNQMTELMRRIRRMTEEEGLRRGRPILVAIRAPESVGFCRAMGIDLERWLKEGLIDILSCGDTFRFEPWENLAAMGKKHDVAVYACFDRRRLQGVTDEPGEGTSNLPKWRGEALAAWRAGVNGVYTFNRFDPRDRIFWEIGDPKVLEGLERVDQSILLNEEYWWNNPDAWVKNGQQFLTGYEGLVKLREAREEAKFRQRRIIMNNDGNDFRLQTRLDLEHPEKFLERRTTGLMDSQADSIFYCTGVFNMYSHWGKEWEMLPPRVIQPELVEEMKQRGIDSLRMMAEYCHRQNREIFWSMRMNDTHDAGEKSRDLFCQWKQDHPEYLVAKREDRKNLPYGNGRWSSVDYGREEVRDKVYRIFEEICQRYDVDGIELDFCRLLVYFREQVWGEDVTWRHQRLMTELISRIRWMTEREGLRRGRPILIAVRVPDSVKFCKAIGIDLERWLKDGLIDIVSGGYVFCLEPWENLVALGKAHNVPVYACFEDRRVEQTWETEGPSNVRLWRGEAWIAWQAGVNGIYTFNRFDPKDPIFREIGDPKILAGLERKEHKTYVNEGLWSRPEVWVKGGRSYLKNDSQVSEMRKKREEAKHRKRRIIYNNDGDDCYDKPNDPKTAEQFLKYRTAALAGSQVDAIFYCDGVFNLYRHGSAALNLGLPETRKPETEILKWDIPGHSDWAWQLKELTGKDNLEIMTEFGKQNGMEVFWSMRMNDTHDAREEALFCDWKRRNPGYLMGERGQKFPYGGRRWSSVNYGLEEVREKAGRILRDVCLRYDVDGIELDFFRHPILFREQMLGEDLRQEQLDQMTEWMRQVRKMTEDMAVWRGRPILVAIRIPDSAGYCRAIGIDLERWLKEGLVDIVTGGGYFHLEPWENLAALGKKYDVPVYACFENFQIVHVTDSPETVQKKWRGEAWNAWQGGVSGIYTFNWFDPTAQMFHEIGDPNILKNLERIDQNIFVNERLYSKPEDWVKDGRSYLKNEKQISQMRKKREEAKQRKRRIIFNNDGNDCVNKPNDPKTKEQFLKYRTAALAGSQVDSIFYCDGVWNLYSHDSKESEVMKVRGSNKPDWAWELKGITGQDNLEIMAEFGKQNGMEVFWSMRMNDTHDSKSESLLCEWKRRNPQCLMGKKDDKFPYGGGRWSAVNYELPEVREKVVRILRDVCVRYEVDGIEMDFLRHLIYFRSEMFGEDITQEQCDRMTDFVREVRQMTEDAGVWRGRPILVAVRVPDSMRLAKEKVGLDVRRWLDEGLVDIVTGGCYFIMEPWENLVALGKQYHVPVYASLSQSRLEWIGLTKDLDRSKYPGMEEDRKYPGLIGNINSIRPAWHGEAKNAWKAGMDGIYIFNVFNPRNPIFRELGSLKTLMPMDWEHQTIVGWPDEWIEMWFKDGRKYIQIPR